MGRVIWESGHILEQDPSDETLGRVLMNREARPFAYHRSPSINPDNETGAEFFGSRFLFSHHAGRCPGFDADHRYASADLRTCVGSCL